MYIFEVFNSAAKIPERPQVTATLLHSFRGKYMPENCWQAGKGASVKGKLRELELGSMGGGQGDLSRSRMPHSESTPWCAVHTCLFKERTDLENLLRKYRTSPTFHLALQFKHCKMIPPKCLETTDNTQNILVRKVCHRMWSGLFSLFIHELLTSVTFFVCLFEGLGFGIWGFGFRMCFSFFEQKAHFSLSNIQNGCQITRNHLSIL